MSTTTNSSSSSSPSSSAFNFPTVLPRKEQPNTHPYAIQTSSTAILSRSNSTSAHASVGPHHYIPESPSPTSPQHSPTKLNRPNRHRYSRSLTSDQPPPLPPPPGAVSLQDNTPRKRVYHAEALSSAVLPPQNLSKDPNSWTPSQLSMYLSANLQAGGSNLTSVANDIAKFVIERRITGKKFLTLSEDDLFQFGISELWRSALLAASTRLRQTILRGRIRGLDYTRSDEEDPGHTSSSGVSSNEDKDLKVRSRHSSQTSDHGKVKDLVHSLEMSSPTRLRSDCYVYDSDSDFSTKFPKRVFSTKDSFSSNHHPHPALSPSKNHRSLPPRGSVNDLFNSAVDSDTAVQSKEDDTTIKNVAKRNVNGREPRMLPFPPTRSPVITPMHTGSHYSNSLSPEHTGTAYGHLQDYEMGFRSPHRSPHSQVFVVRHNPASPSNSLHFDEANTKRLLPLPPVTGETHLHHPKPRRLVGNIDDPSVTDTASPEVNRRSVNVSTDSNTSGTEGYETALEAPSESEGHSNIPGAHEEPTMRELVASEPPSNPISGVEAWELDLGETVKRIGNTDDGGFKRGSSVAEIRRKVGKHPTAPRAGRGATNMLNRGHILNLFNPSDDDKKLSDDISNGSEMLDLQERKLAELEKGVQLKEQHLSEKEQAIAERERAVTEREKGITQKEQANERWEVDVERREGVVAAREQGLMDRQVLEAEEVSAMRKEIQERVIKVEDRQRLLQARQETLKNQEANVARREEIIQGREIELKQWEKRIEAKERELNEKISAASPAASVPVNILRKCWNLLGVDVATHHLINPRNIRQDILFGYSGPGGCLILMSIGVCVVALRVLRRRYP